LPLLLQVDGVLRHLVEGCHHARIGLVAPLRDDEVCKFGRNIDVRLFQCAARDGPEPPGCWCADGGLAGSESGGKIIAAVPGESLLVGEAGERDLSQDGCRPVAEGSGDAAVGPNIEILQSAAAGAILLNGGGAVGGSQLRDDPVAVCVEYVPGVGQLIGAVGENRLRVPRGRYIDGGISGRGGAIGRSDTLQGSIAVENERTAGQGNGGGGAGNVGGGNRNGVSPGVDDGGDGGGGVDSVRTRARAPAEVVRGTIARAGRSETGRARVAAVKSITPLPTSTAVALPLAEVPVP